MRWITQWWWWWWGWALYTATRGKKKTRNLRGIRFGMGTMILLSSHQNCNKESPCPQQQQPVLALSTSTSVNSVRSSQSQWRCSRLSGWTATKWAHTIEFLRPETSSSSTKTFSHYFTCRPACRPCRLRGPLINICILNGNENKWWGWNEMNR